MFELLLIVCLAAAVVCILKGLIFHGVVLSIGVSAVAAVCYVIDDALDSGLVGTFALAATAIGAIAVAMTDPRPESWWGRRAKVAEGNAWAAEHGILVDPPHARLLRMSLGVLIGLAHGALFAGTVLLGRELFDLPDDTIRLAYLAIPLGILGAIVGATIGHTRVPGRGAFGEPAGLEKHEWTSRNSG